MFYTYQRSPCKASEKAISKVTVVNNKESWESDATKGSRYFCGTDDRTNQSTSAKEGTISLCY